MGIVTGKGLKLTTTTDVVTARDSLEWYDAKQVAVARGDAIAVNLRHTICRRGGKPRARCSNGTTFMIRLLPKDQTAA